MKEVSFDTHTLTNQPWIHECMITNVYLHVWWKLITPPHTLLFNTIGNIIYNTLVNKYKE